MRVLISGGSGFLGARLVRAYVERGDDVVVTVRRFPKDGKRTAAGGPYGAIEGSLGDAVLERAVREARVDVVHHLAYDLGALNATEEEDARVNVRGSAALIEAAIEGGASHVVLASSGFVYGDAAVLPIPETHPLRPNTANGKSKLAVERALSEVCAARSVSLTILRYANLYDSLLPSPPAPRPARFARGARGEDGREGSDASLSIGSRDRSVIARFAEALRRGEPARIAGDGWQTRDFIHVGDVVRANLAAADQRLAGAFNVGTGVEISIAEVWEIVQEALGMRGTVERSPARGDDRARNALDGSLLRKMAGLPDPVSVREGVGRIADC